MTDTTTKTETKNDRGAQVLGFLGVLLLIAGIGPLGYMAIEYPDWIVLADASSIEFGAMRSYGAGEASLIIAWTFFLTPILIVMGSVFVAASVIAGAFKN